MKKFLLLGCMMLLVSAANASYLYWQIESDVDETATLKSSETSDGEGEAVTVYAVVDDGYGNAILAPTETLVPGVVYAIDSTTVDSGYSYWVEMSNSSAAAQKYSGEDFASMTYSDAAETTSLADIAEGTVPVGTWHASSGSMTAPVPEPTSAILMMFGMAFLGLKRKNRSIA